ncbi:MAG: class IV adenylate cyclase [Planctomycetota bacterium]
MLNVEYKAELREPELARAALERIGAEHEATLRQIDTYYHVPTGRLKKRDVPGRPSEYIVYERADRPSPKLSKFSLLDTSAFQERYGQRPLPVLVVVEKSRELLLLGDVRIHLDDVKDLGRFLEIEALVSPRQHVAQCHSIVAHLREKLGPTIGEPISSSYMDLMLAERETSEHT